MSRMQMSPKRNLIHSRNVFTHCIIPFTISFLQHNEMPKFWKRHPEFYSEISECELTYFSTLSCTQWCNWVLCSHKANVYRFLQNERGWFFSSPSATSFFFFLELGYWISRSLNLMLKGTGTGHAEFFLFWKPWGPSLII